MTAKASPRVVFPGSLLAGDSVSPQRSLSSCSGSVSAGSGGCPTRSSVEARTPATLACKPWRGPLPARRRSPCLTLGDCVVYDRRVHGSAEKQRLRDVIGERRSFNLSVKSSPAKTLCLDRPSPSATSTVAQPVHSPLVSVQNSNLNPAFSSPKVKEREFFLSHVMIGGLNKSAWTVDLGLFRMMELEPQFVNGVNVSFGETGVSYLVRGCWRLGSDLPPPLSSFVEVVKRNMDGGGRKAPGEGVGPGAYVPPGGSAGQRGGGAGRARAAAEREDVRVLVVASMISMPAGVTALRVAMALKAASSMVQGSIQTLAPSRRHTCRVGGGLTSTVSMLRGAIMAAPVALRGGLVVVEVLGIMPNCDTRCH
ncbi:hypothetical protein ACP70R_011943 [Stipagrostis hirtigluma subsp. patula]